MRPLRLKDRIDALENALLRLGNELSVNNMPEAAANIRRASRLVREVDSKIARPIEYPEGGDYKRESRRADRIKGN